MRTGISLLIFVRNIGITVLYHVYIYLQAIYVDVYMGICEYGFDCKLD